MHARSQRTRSHVPSFMFVVDRHTWKIIKCSRNFLKWINTTKKQTVISTSTHSMRMANTEKAVRKWRARMPAPTRPCQIDCAYQHATWMFYVVREFTSTTTLAQQHGVSQSQLAIVIWQQQQYSGHSITRQRKFNRKENVANRANRNGRFSSGFISFGRDET